MGVAEDFRGSAFRSFFFSFSDFLFCLSAVFVKIFPGETSDSIDVLFTDPNETGLWLLRLLLNIEVGLVCTFLYRLSASFSPML